MSKKCILAFSGGLDTSYCAIYLKKELGLEVHSAIVNTGGFSEEELQAIAEKARSLGVDSHKTIDVTEDFYKEGIRYLVFGNVLKNGNYPLSVSAERVFQARALVEYAKETGAEYIAHGSTGAGNDQVRFDMIFQTLYPAVKILTPIRDKQLSRKEEVDYLRENGIDQSWEKAKYSINKGLWGTSVGGDETLTSRKPLPESAWPTPIEKNEPEELELEFLKGEIVAVNGKKTSAVKAIQKIHELAAPFGIGRDIHVGDTIIGIKGRVGFEAAAPHIIIKAHQLLEKHTLSKWQLQLKQQLSDWYGMFFHEGQFLDPAMRNIEAFLQSSQENVSGKVFLRLLPHHFELLGIESSHDLMQSDFAQYGEGNKAWTADDAKGFIKINGNASRLWHSVNGFNVVKS